MWLKSWLKSGAPNRQRGHLIRHEEQQSRYLRLLKRRRRTLRVENLEDRTVPTIQLTTGIPAWVDQGPRPVTQAQLTVPPNNPVVGAIEAVAIGPNGQLAYAATVNGGIWRTNDITAATPTWVAQTDHLNSLAMGSIAFSPLDASGQTVFAGTAQFGNSAEAFVSPAAFGVGLYRTTTGGTTWINVGNADLAARSVRRVLPTAIDVNPGNGAADLNDQVVFAATADPDGTNAAGRPGGLFRSTDGGANFTDLSSVDVGDPGKMLPAGDAMDIMADPNNNMQFYAAIAGQGVFRSDDGGEDWDPINTGLTGLALSMNIELAAHDTGANTVIYVGVIGPEATLTGLFRDDTGRNGLDTGAPGVDDPGEHNFSLIGQTGGITSTAVSAGNPITVTTAAPHGFPNPSSITVAITGVGGHPAANGHFRATITGASTFTLDNTTAAAGTPAVAGAGGTWTTVPLLHTGQQGVNNFSITADPGNANLVYVGGDRPPSVHRVAANTNTFTAITHSDATPNATPGDTAPHADSRSLVFLGNNLIETDDGGIYRLNNPATSSGANAVGTDWASVNGNLGVIEFLSVSYDTEDDLIFGGTQDNGSNVQSATGSTTWQQFFGGDGNTQAYDAVNDRRYALANNFGFFLRDGAQLKLASTAVGALPFSGLEANKNTSFRGQAPTDRGFVGNGGGFEPRPFVLNAVDPNRMLIGREALYESIGAAGQPLGDVLQPAIIPGRPNVAVASPATQMNRASALAYGGRQGGTNFPLVAFAGSETGQLFFRGQAGGAFVDISNGAVGTGELQPPHAAIRDIILDPEDWRRVYVIRGNEVWRTNDVTALVANPFTNITGNLVGPAPALTTQLRTITLFDTTSTTANDSVVLVGGLGGVFRLDTTTGAWSEIGSAMPNTLVEDVHFIADDPDGNAGNGTGFLLAGTLGRGAWIIPNISLSLPAGPSVLQVTGTAGADTFTLTRNAADPTMVDVQVSNAGPGENGSFLLANLAQIQVNGLGSNDTLVVNSSNGILTVPGGIVYTGGDGTGDIVRFLGKGTTEFERAATATQNGLVQITSSDGRQVVSFTGVETLENTIGEPTNVLGILGLIGGGLSLLAVGFGVIPKEFAALGIALPILGFGLGELLSGADATEITPFGIPGGPKAAGLGEKLPGDASFLQRIFEEGPNGFRLGDIGRTITTTEGLRQFLDNLDATVGNVTLTETGGVTRYDVRVKKTLSGTSDFAVDALGGRIDLSGDVEASVDVNVHLVFGMDDKGFFFDATGPEPEFVLNNVQISGGIRGSGRLGFLDVTLTDGSLAVDPQLAVSLDVRDPGPDPLTDQDDGLIRTYELDSIADLVTPQIQGNPAADDLVLTGTFAVGIVIGGGAPFTLGAAGLALKWADVSDLTTVRVEATGPAGQTLTQFLNLSAFDIGAMLEKVGSSIQAVAAGLSPSGGIPFVSEKLGQLADFTSTLADLARSLFDIEYTGASLYTAADTPLSDGPLDEAVDAVFGVQVNDGPLVEVTATFPSGTSTIGQLVTAVNAALDAAPLPAGGFVGDVVTASDDGGRIKLAAAATTDRLIIRYRATDDGMEQLGFEPSISKAVFRFNSLQSLIPEILKLLPSGLNLSYDPATAELTFDLDFSKTFRKELDLDFGTEIDLGVVGDFLGDLALTGRAKASAEVTAGLNLRVGIDLSPVGDGFVATLGTPLINLNAGAGVQNVPGETDLKFTLRDGITVFEVNIDGDATLGDVANSIEEASRSNPLDPGTRRVTATIIPDDPATDSHEDVGLLLTDLTTGTTTFKVEKVNDSLAGFGLGILGSDLDGDGKIVGTPLHGDTLLGHAFIAEGAGLSASATLAAEDIDLFAALGFIEAGIVDGSGSFTIGASLTLNDPGVGPQADGKILLTEFGPGLVGASVTAETDAPANGQLLADAAFTLAADGGAAVSVSVLQSATTTNSTRDDLASDVNAALGATDFGAAYAGTPYAGKKLGDVFSASIVDKKVVIGGVVNDMALAGAEELGFAASATDTGSVVDPNFTATGSLTLPIVLRGLEAFGISIPAGAKVMVTLGPGNPVDVDIDLVDLDPEIVNPFENFSLSTLLQLGEKILGVIRNSDLAIFSDPLPLINKSVKDLLSFLQPIEDALAAIKGNIQELKSTISAAFEDLHAVFGEGLDDGLIAQLRAAGEGDLADELLEAVEEFEHAVAHLPDTIADALTFQLPAGLVSSFAAVREAVTELIDKVDTAIDLGLTPPVTTATLDELKSVFNPIRDALPSAFSAANFIMKALGFDDLIQIPNLTTGLATLLADIATLEGAAGLPAEVVTAFKSVREALDDAIDESFSDVDLTALIRALSQFQTALTTYGPDITAAGLATTLTSLQGTFAVMSGSFPARIGITFVDDAVQFMVHFSKDPDPFPINLDFGANLDDFPLPVSVQTSGTVSVDLAASLDLGFGIDFSNLSNLDELLFLDPTSRIGASALITGDNLEAKISFGGISAGLENGIFLLDSDATNTTVDDPISLGFSLSHPDGDPDGDGRVQLEHVDDALQFDAPTGGFRAEFDIDPGIPILSGDPRLVVTIPDITDFTTLTVELPEFDFSGIQLDLSTILAGIDQLLQLLEKGLQSDVAGGIPLIGDGLDEAGEFIGDFRNNIFTPVRDFLLAFDATTSSPDAVKDLIQRVLFDSLGHGFDPDDPNNIDLFDSLTPLDILAEADSRTLITVYTDIDVTVEFDEAGGLTLITDPAASVAARLHVVKDATVELPFDLGIDAFGLVSANADGAVELGAKFDAEFGLEVSKQDGVLLLLNETTPASIPDLVLAANPAAPPTGEDPELEIGLDVSLVEGTTATVKLFFLQLGISERPGGPATGLSGNLFLDLEFPTPEVPLAQVLDLDLNPDLTAQVDVDLTLDAGIAGPEGLNTNFPSVAADLIIDWAFDLDGGGTLNKLRLDNIRVDLGEFLSGPIGKLLNGLDKFIDPIRPILDFLNSEVPLISQVSQLVGAGPFTFADGIALFGEGGETINTVIGLLTSLDNFLELVSTAGNVVIDFGDFVLVDPTVPGLPGGNILAGGLGSLNLGAGKFLSSFESSFNDPANADLKDKVEDLEKDPEEADPGLGLEFPLLKDPGQIVNLLFGGAVDLVTWDVPRLEASFEYSQLFGPIIPPFPVFAKIAGAFGVFADFFVGLDTRGFQTGNFFNGIYFGDRTPPTPTGEDTPEVGLFMEFTAGAEINLAIAKAGVEGGVRADLAADWNDPNEDGKYYLDEVLANAALGPECIFDLTGALTAFLRAYLKIEIDVGFFSITIIDTDFTIIDVTLFDFSVSCPPLPPPVPAHVSNGADDDDEIRSDLTLADGTVLTAGSLLPTGTLILHSGQFSNLRQSGAGDIADVINIRSEKDLNGDGEITSTVDVNGDGVIEPDNGDLLGEDLNGDGDVDDSGFFVVEAYGVTHIYTGVTQIFVDLGQDNDESDTLTVDPFVTVPVIALGGPGDDEIQAALGADRVSGGDGKDKIRLGAGNDTARGGSDNDDIAGSGGADSLDGGDGDDLIYGGDNDKKDVGDLGDVIFGGAGGDRLYGHLGGDTVRGGTGSDQIHGNQGGDSLFGDEDDDQLFGDADSDSMQGGAGNDQLSGADGNDWMMGGSSAAIADGNDVLVGEAGDDVMLGDNGQFGSVTLLGGTAGDDQLVGGDGNDEMYGQGGNDLVIGDGSIDLATGTIGFDALGVEGTDYMEGNAGGDEMHGGALNDRMIGGGSVVAGLDGADRMFGDDGDDVLLGDNGTISAAGDVVTNPAGGAGSDSVDGGVGNDVLFGGGQGDLLAGDPVAGTGEDIVVGDQGTRTATLIVAAHSTVAGSAGADDISGQGGDDILLGGDNGDSIAGAGGLDVAVGDNGQVTLSASGDVIRVETADPSFGGDDQITGGAAADILLGGQGNDVVNGGAEAAADILLGDNGTVVLEDGSPEENNIFTTDPTHGGQDSLFGGGGNDIGLGGTDDDQVEGSDGTDILLGDHGRINRTDGPTPVVEFVKTTDGNLGGDDFIFGNAGFDVLFGGFAADMIEGNAGDDVLVGDNGGVFYVDDPTTTEVEGDGDVAVADLVRAFADGLGGSDSMSGNAGADLAAGGADGDLIYGDDATASAGTADLADILLGDDADVSLVATGGASGGDLRVVLGAAVEKVRTTDDGHPEFGGSDDISGNAGGDIIAGGVQGDSLYGDRAAPTTATTAADGNDVVLGDNGALEWLSTGRLAEVSVDVEPINAALFTKYGGGTADTELTTLDLVTTEQPTNGGRDLILGDEGKDVLLGGTDADTIYGDDNDAAHTGAATNNDVLFGDHGRLYPQFSTLGAAFPSRNFFAIDVGDADGGEGDRMWGEEGDDVLLGQQGDDRMFGNGGDDDLTGGHNVAGGIDELTLPAVTATTTVAVNDLMDGGTGDDALAGDNASMWRRADDRSPRFRQLTTAAMYAVTDTAITANVAGASENDPNGAVGRDITLLDHSTTIPAGQFGADVMAGGANNDVLFGELGNDLMQGDGFLGADDGVAGTVTHQVTVADSGASPDTDETLFFNIPEATTDGDDYLEGNGGDDRMYGGLGQDDLIGGSSAQFALTSADLRPDGADQIFGGVGTRITRNDQVAGGDAFFAERHARDADAIVGDNGNVIRPVTAGGAFPTFNYDVNGLPAEGYVASRRIVPRAVELLDYTPGGPDITPLPEAAPANVAINPATGVRDVGAADELRGESGDDVMYGMVGGDVMYGDAQDDNMVGGYDADWVSGGTGDDGILGDDGVLYVSRNGTFGEPLYGVAGFAPADLNRLISIPGQFTNALVNVSGLLKYTADLTPDNLQPNLNPVSPNTLFRPLYANDIIYGGLGHDAIHAGAGDDATSGAEAPAVSYTNNYDPATGAQLNGTPIQSDFFHPVNPGNVLGYNPATTKLAQYDAFDALRRVQLDPADGNLWKGPMAGGLTWLLDFDSNEGPVDTRWIVGQTEFLGVATDGDDHVFADLGNDWSVGGTGRDIVYAGWGDDVLNLDDVPTSHDGLNDVTDTNPSWEDLTYGGAGRDVLLVNTNGDRAFDWIGEFNTFRTPYSQFGAVSVNRFLQPQLAVFLYALSKSNGADQSLAAKYGNPARNGEPFGEMGLVLQPDAAWQDQSGAPRDPQGGNLPGGKVDVKNNPGTAGVQTIFMRAAGRAPRPASAAPFLTDAQLAPIVAQARQYWSARLGATALDGLKVVIGDLPQGKLGALVGGVIVIDGKAAGRGWFVDPTPADNSEFTRRNGTNGLVATRSSSAYGLMDLLTVVTHELGHALGLDHEPGGAMAETMRPGERLTTVSALPVELSETRRPAAGTARAGWFLSGHYRR